MSKAKINWDDAPHWANYAVIEEKTGKFRRWGSVPDYGIISITEDESVLLRPEDDEDMVNHPPHYTQGDIECIDAIKAALTPDEFRGYCKGAALKYCWRERHKGGDESLKKAVWYLNKAVEVGV